MRSVFALFMVISLALPTGASLAQVSPAPKLSRAVRTELKSTPNILLWVDVKAFRNSNFYPVVSTTVHSVQKMLLKSSKCMKHLTPSNVDYVLVAISKKKHKESGYISLSGSFSASKLVNCLGRDQKMKRTTFKGYPAWQDKKDEFLYAPSMGSMVLIKAVGHAVHPRKGILGQGHIRKLRSSRFLVADIGSMRKRDGFKALVGHGTLGSKMLFKGSVYFHSVDEARKAMSQLKGVTGNVLAQPLTKTLTFRRRGATIFADYSMDTTQLTYLNSTLSMLLGRKKSTPHSHQSTPRKHY